MLLFNLTFEFEDRLKHIVFRNETILHFVCKVFQTASDSNVLVRSPS